MISFSLFKTGTASNFLFFVLFGCEERKVRTCVSVSFQFSSGSIGIDCGDFDVIRRVWIQVLQDDIVFVSWHCCLVEKR